MGAKLPSPCIGVCKFKRAGHCLGCAMTKPQKKRFKALGGAKAQRAFLVALQEQQRRLGKYRHWAPAYVKKCRKKGIEAPLDGD